MDACDTDKKPIIPRLLLKDKYCLFKELKNSIIKEGYGFVITNNDGKYLSGTKHTFDTFSDNILIYRNNYSDTHYIDSIINHINKNKYVAMKKRVAIFEVNGEFKILV